MHGTGKRDTFSLSLAILPINIGTNKGGLRDSTVCYAYLDDVESTHAAYYYYTRPATTPGSQQQGYIGTTGNNLARSQFENSLWFTRGWTLPELLAPSRLVFFAQDWTVIGDRKDMASHVSDITNIHLGVLKSPSTINQYSIAQRMSWASGRHTSQKEDLAYCLLGIFNVHMGIKYGEGVKAFRRLQEEIISSSDDQSILAWGSFEERWTLDLAESPRDFKMCGSIVQDPDLTCKEPYWVTNIGIYANLPLVETPVARVLLAGLNCSREVRDDGPAKRDRSVASPPRRDQVWIPIRKIGEHYYARGYLPISRVCPQKAYPTTVVFRSLYLMNGPPRRRHFDRLNDGDIMPDIVAGLDKSFGDVSLITTS